jgi:transcriptional regulator with XRE-family HTH domain
MDTLAFGGTRQELAHFLASRRARLMPHDVGLPQGHRRRRVPGLRREEVAVLANVSETWYTRLEQGQEINVSHDVLDAIARALRLDAHERAYLFMLAGPAERSDAAPAQLPVLPSSVAATLDALALAPAVVYGPRYDVLLCNRAYVAVFGDIAESVTARGNVVRQMFLDQSRRTLFPDWESVARALLQSFRMNAGRHAGDPAFGELIAGLRSESAMFDSWWEEHDVERRATGEKLVEHPLAGRLILDHVAFALPDQPEVITIVYTAARGSESERKLHALCEEAR